LLRGIPANEKRRGVVAADGLNASDYAESARQRDAIAFCWVVIGAEEPNLRNPTYSIESW
jgi:hypothetical protein